MTVDAFTLLDSTMKFTVPDVAQRVLGQQDINAGPSLALAYWQDPRAQAEWGNYTITVLANRSGFVFPWVVFRVDGINIGTDASGNTVTVSIRFWGQSSGVTTVVTRIGWFLVPFQHLGENFWNRFTGHTGQPSLP